jgi:hypothetical protein
MDRGIWNRIWGTGKLNQGNFNEILKKAKGKQELSKGEEFIVENYKKYLGTWDPTVEPHTYFEGTWKGDFKGSTLDRTNKKITLYSDTAKDKVVRTLDLTKPADRKQLVKYLVGSSGVGADANLMDNFIEEILGKKSNTNLW